MPITRQGRDLRSRHELTTAMQQLYNTLEDILVSQDLQLY